MGVIHLKWTLASSLEEKDIQKARQLAVREIAEEFKDNGYEDPYKIATRIVTPVIPGSNGYFFFTIMPDGSKKGWEFHYGVNQSRKRLISKIKEKDWRVRIIEVVDYDWVCVGVNIQIPGNGEEEEE